jgi:hypothetical protein
MALDRNRKAGPGLVQYMLVRLAIGFAMGSFAAVALLVFAPISLGAPGQWLEILLVIYGFGSVFALGFLATALASENDG